MKQYIKITWVLAIALLLVMPNSNVKAQPGVSVSFQMFYDELSPYGRWIDAPGQGYVWVPNVGSDFRPYYSGGHWVMTEYGNTWVSDYDWGWAPFHYGRWTYDPYYGWIWVPDTVWGPAWVSWRNGGGYYGWAPLAPGINVNIAIGPRYTVANDWWVFIPHKYIYSPRFHSHYRGPRYNTTIINRTTIINNTYVYNNNRYITGPRRDDIERRTGQRVVTYDVRDNNRPGRSSINDRSVNIYRPRVEQRKDNLRPQNVTNAERPIRTLDRAGNDNNLDGRNPADRPMRNDRAIQEQMNRNAQQRTEPQDRDVRMQQNERNEQARQQREARQREMQQRSQQDEAQRQRQVQERNNNIAAEQRQHEAQERNRAAEQRQNAEVQRQRQIQQRAEQQQRIEQNRQQHWERRQETEQRPQQMQQRPERQAPQRNMQPQQRPEQRESPSRERRGR